MEWLENNETPDLIMMDIELLDGQSFEIFNRVKVMSPVIFTTSYDEYALKAFKVNSVDYLLKPIQKEDLAAALDKFRKMFVAAAPPSINMDMLVKELQQKLQPKEFRKRFLVKNVQKLVSVETDEIAYFYSDGRLNFFKTYDKNIFMVILQNILDVVYMMVFMLAKIIPKSNVKMVSEQISSKRLKT